MLGIKFFFLSVFVAWGASGLLSQAVNIFNTTGYVGIGTTSPAAQLEIYRVVGGPPALLRLNTAFSGGNTVEFNPFITGVNNGGFELTLAGTRRLVIDPLGNIGMGTTTPGATLELYRSGAGNFLKLNSKFAGGLAYAINAGITGVSNGGFEIRDLTNSVARFVIDASGNVGIGTATPSQKLSVNGTIRAKEMIVETTGWSDYVFADEYALQPLSEVERQIKREKHLPGIPSAKEAAERGIGLGDMQAKLLAKIEELTLHVETDRHARGRECRA